MYSEAQILEVANTKDEVLYKRLYDIYYAPLCHYAARLLRHLENEEDVVQEVFMKFWEMDSTFTTARAVTTYLYRAVYNACLNIIRDEKGVMTFALPSDDIFSDFYSTEHERVLIEEEYFRQIYVVIDTLSRQRRQVILKTLEGKTVEIIADELNISVNTVKTLKKKAYSELRGKLPAPLFGLFLLLANGL